MGGWKRPEQHARGRVADLGVGVEQAVVDEEGRQQRHAEEEHEDPEAHHALPVAPVESPHLVGVPREELGALVIAGRPEPGGHAAEHDHAPSAAPSCSAMVLTPADQPEAPPPARKAHTAKTAPMAISSEVEPRAPSCGARDPARRGRWSRPRRDHDPRRVRRHALREEALEHGAGAGRPPQVLRVLDELEREPDDRRPEEDPVPEAARDLRCHCGAGTHACTRGSR